MTASRVQQPLGRSLGKSLEPAWHLLGMGSYDQLEDAHRGWVEEALRNTTGRRREWTESIAVGSRHFVDVDETKTRLGFRASGRMAREADGVYELRESRGAYSAYFGPQNEVLSSENTRFWNAYLDKPES